jgi:hypothetical protein
VVHLDDEPDNFDAQFVVVATDGLWDVISSEEVVRLVRSVQQREWAAAAAALSVPNGGTPDGEAGQQKHQQQRYRSASEKKRPSGSSDTRGGGDWVATAVMELTREAYVRSSMDNIGVYIVPFYS